MFIFKWIGDAIGWVASKIPLWGWIIVGVLSLAGVGAWAFKVYVDRTVSGYEKRIEEETRLKNNAEIEKNAAKADAVTNKQQRDSALSDIKTIESERLALSTEDSRLRGELSITKRQLSVKAAKERARLGDPAQFQEQLDATNSELDCAVENINKPGSCTVQQ
jgi:hypothetical protein